MNTKEIFDLCKAHGYRNIPSSEEIFRHTLDLEQNTDVDYDNLLSLASIVEFREKHNTMFKDQKDQIELSDLDRMKGVCLTLWSDNVDNIEMFRALCRANLPKDLGWFHQCNAKDFQMFEFWKPQSDPVKEVTRRIAYQMDLPFLVALGKSYAVGTPVTLKAFNTIDIEDYYEHGNFFG